MDSLNSAQREAVLCTDGPVLILAGAGSGKTRVLTHRVAYLIYQKGIKPWHILAVTFTNKAATEMKDRILKLSRGAGKESWIGTFHSICARILRVEGEKLGYGKNFLIFDRDDQKRFIKNVMEDLNVSEKEFQPEAVLNAISGAKNAFVRPDEYQTIAKAPFEYAVSRVYPLYQRMLKQNNIMDFDDLLVNPLLLFQEYPTILEQYQNRFSYLLVDEFQDTNRTQYIFLKYLAGRNRNLCVVGDDDQSIYRWRGAEIENILNIENDYPDCKIFHLEQNYRSTKNILNLANSIVKNNQLRRDKTLWTEREEGDKVTVLELDDAYAEALNVVGIIKDELMAGSRDFSDFAILYRTNAQSRLLEDALRQAAIPYVIVGGVKFYERKEIKDVLAYLRLTCNPRDTVSFKRVINFPLRGIGDSSVLKLEDFADANSISLLEAAGRADEVTTISSRIRKSILEFFQLISKYASLREQFSAGELAQALVDEIGILRSFKEINTEESFLRAENVRELLLAIVNYTKTNKAATLDAFLEEVTLITDIDNWDDKSNAVTLMTLHSAKGLEFPVVFVTGLEEGLFPLSRTFDNHADLEEERRLFYVGSTRAKEKLFITWAAVRPRYGESFNNLPSRFLKEMDQSFFETRNLRRFNHYRSERASSNPDYSPSYAEIADEYAEIVMGREVKHELFGIGKILRTDGHGENMKITVRFYEAGEKRLVVKYANLEVLY
ncbi:MAG TPA: UvrD-helicase domain-containing protein [bacterium]